MGFLAAVVLAAVFGYFLCKRFLPYKVLSDFEWLQNFIFNSFKTKNPLEKWALENFPLAPSTESTKDVDLCKQSYTRHRDEILSTKYDYIVVGSGLGGLSTAALLSAYGKKVLVLEQHDVAGGCCHTFNEKGFEFDTGVHYVGGLNNPRKLIYKLFKFITQGRLDWEPMDFCFDEVVFGGKSYFFQGTKQQQIESLSKSFPHQSENIRKYFQLLEFVSFGYRLNSIHLIFPLTFQPVFKYLVHCLTYLLGTLCGYKSFLSAQAYHRYSKIMVSQVLDEIFADDVEIKTVLMHPNGDYGLAPNQASFAIHSMVLSHYFGGASYPIGGSQEIPRSIIPVIEKAGGKVVVKAAVAEILTQNHDHRLSCVGIRMDGKYSQDVIYGPVISDAGAYNTFVKLLSKDSHPWIQKELGMLNQKPAKSGGSNQCEDLTDEGIFIGKSIGHIYVFAGFRGSSQENNVKARNYWLFDHVNYPEYNSTFMKDPESPISAIFLSFPSAKDPKFSQKYPDKTTCVALCEADFEWFQEWKDEKIKHRGSDYESLKRKFESRILSVLYRQ
eukprot:Sdes_comp9190_c0_seq1m661